MKLQVGVKVLIKNADGLYLLIERAGQLSANDKVLWDIPGGRINPDESLDAALAREVQEEIGLKLTSKPRLVAAQDIFVKDKDLHVVRLTYLTTENISKVILSDEHQNYCWVALADTSSLNLDPYLQDVIDQRLKD